VVTDDSLIPRPLPSPIKREGSLTPDPLLGGQVVMDCLNLAVMRAALLLTQITVSNLSPYSFQAYDAALIIQVGDPTPFA
jgi:hypothetical protein